MENYRHVSNNRKIISIGITGLVLVLSCLVGYHYYYQSKAGYTARVNEIALYWKTLTPDKDIDGLIQRYGTPLTHKTNIITVSAQLTEQTHQLEFQNIDIRATTTSQGDMTVSAVSVKTDKVPIKYGLDINTPIGLLEKTLGQPFDKKSIDDAIVYTYIPILSEKDFGKKLGYVEFIYRDKNLVQINWLTDIDD